MKIEMNREYTTRDGRPVRILCTDARVHGGSYSVIAIVGEAVNTYTENGHIYAGDYRSGSGKDLIEKVEPIVRYCNVYHKSVGSSCSDEASANSCRQVESIGCLKITITGKDVKTEFIPKGDI